MNPEEYERCLAHLRPRYQLREDERSVLQYRYCGNIQQLILHYCPLQQLGRYHGGNRYPRWEA